MLRTIFCTVYCYNNSKLFSNMEAEIWRKKFGPPYYGLVLVAGRTIARNSCMILSLSLFWRSRTANSCRRSSQKFSRHCRCSSTKDWNHTGGWSLRLFGALPGCGCSAGVSVALALVLLLQVVQLAADTTF